MKCLNSATSGNKSGSSPVTIALFHSAGSNATTQAIHKPLNIVRIFSKLILWGPSVELERQSHAGVSNRKLNFDNNYKSFKKLGILINLESIPILIAMSSLNLSDHIPYYMPTIMFLGSKDMPFVMLLTEHFEFITCSALSIVKKQENAYLNVFDGTTWAIICASVILSATTVRFRDFCTTNPNPEVSLSFTKKYQ